MKKTLSISLSTLAATALLGVGGASAATTCNLYAAPGGSDTAAGTAAAPFATVGKLVSTLSSGQSGCLQSGSYHEDVTFHTGGITLTAADGASATIIGRMWIPQGTDGVTVSNLHLDGVNAQNLPSPTVNGNSATFSGDEVTDEHTAICYDLGSDAGWGTTTGTVITRNRIHDCGVLPAANHDHGIYVESARNTTISWNLIYANADRGVQLYPDAQNTTIAHNVIDANGEGVDFSGDFGGASNGNQVYANLLTNAKLRYDAESWYPAGNPVGTNNLLQNNCIYGGAEGTIDTSSGGFTVGSNTIADPQYVNPAAGNYQLRTGSPCLALTGDVAAVVDGTQSSTSSSSTTSITSTSTTSSASATTSSSTTATASTTTATSTTPATTTASTTSAASTTVARSTTSTATTTVPVTTTTSTTTSSVSHRKPVRRTATQADLRSGTTSAKKTRRRARTTRAHAKRRAHRHH